MGDISTFISEMKAWCEERDLGYDQMQRWDIRPGGEADCSSLVIRALQDSGFDTGSASYTGDLSSNLCARGWVRLPVDGNPQPGDICLNDAEHVAVCTSLGMISYASIDENGGISGGESGDQTGFETKTAPYYDHPWDCYLRYVGGQPQPVPLSGGTYECIADCGVNVRTAPSTSSEVVATYSKGDTVILDNTFIESEGITWGQYTGTTSGMLRYVAVIQNGEYYFQKLY